MALPQEGHRFGRWAAQVGLPQPKPEELSMYTRPVAGDGVLVVGERQQEMLQRREIVAAFVGVREPPGQRLRVKADQVTRLENTIDRLNAKLAPLTSFILPGGTPAAAWCHLARTVCRRAERDVVALSRNQSVNPQVIVYLNRLSDLCWVLARYAEKQSRTSD